VLMVTWFRNEVIVLIETFGGYVGMAEHSIQTITDAIKNSRPSLASEWFFPLNALLTLLAGWIFAGFVKRDKSLS